LQSPLEMLDNTTYRFERDHTTPMHPDPSFENRENIPPCELTKFVQPARMISGNRHSSPRPPKATTRRSTTQARPAKRAAPTATEEAPHKKPRGGRMQGSSNYSAADLEKLLDILEIVLPLGNKGWATVTDQFNQWAKDNRRPTRQQQSLQIKFQNVRALSIFLLAMLSLRSQLVRTEKPTGDAECPIEIERAHSINYEMNTKAGTRDLDDDDDASAISISSDSDLPPVSAMLTHIKREPGLKTEPRSAVIRAAKPSNQRSTYKATGQQLLSNISKVLDPSLQATREEERANRSLQATQLLTLSNQLRDAQAQLETLRNRLMDSDRARLTAERRADRSELREMFQRERRREIYSPQNLPRRGRLRRQEVQYPDGGEATMWIDSDGDKSDHAADPPGTIRITHDPTPPTSPITTHISHDPAPSNAD